ncbi:Quinone oxidoreductase [Candidatus Phaeomarinobacter ectocarpi]|uniref:Quinone oxidoreductase n=1 Tax=Candidatus Phaeomarinibacter ectocarpi TaxID=1458461 RepID=X5M756_9HYPH|nr:NAD(P)H-quinone oxidoreductase [Candidatus Phaeomarinobacter ectocarpi]CDO58933.1 Quinone oxidoreductase [Candidatus Phaeomarinobacter ectocarpi]
MTNVPATMNAVEISEFGGPDVLKLTECMTPQLAHGEVLIKVAAAGVNRGDCVQRMGFYPAPPGASDLPGLEVSGTLAAIGPGVSLWKEGDEVCALMAGGGYAEYAVVHEGSVLPRPEGVSLVEAAALPETVMTVWTNVFEDGQLRPGETLLIHGGSSGIGTTAIQLASTLGVKVIATAGSADKCKACEDLGAVRAINYREEDFVEVVKEVTDGKGADVILDMVGGDYVARNIEAAARQGRIVNIAYMSGSRVEVDLLPLMLKRLTLRGSTLRARDVAEKARLTSEVRMHVWPLIEAGRIKAVVDDTYPLADASKAHERMESSGHVGKILLTP